MIFAARIAALLAFVLSSGANAQDALFDWFDYQGSNPALPANIPPGNYSNPILSGFYPDPSIVRVGEDFFLVNSSFSYFPGIPVFHSRDLIHWNQIGNAIDRPSQLNFAKLGISRGVFAPAISWHNGLFYIVNTCVDCGGNFVITAKEARGPWSDPVWLPDLEGGIDPSLFFDEDGKAYIVNNGAPDRTPLYDGHRALWIQQFDVASKKTIGPRRVLVDGGVDISKKPVWIEGPHIFRKDGFYFLIAAEGGTAENHSEVVFRSRNVLGPYEPLAANPILTQRDLPADRPFPITSSGHADFVSTPKGDWWSVFLATQPYANDMYNTGRETFLLPVTWSNGWPRVLAAAQAIPHVHATPDLPTDHASKVPTSGNFSVRDEFDGPTLPLYWMTPRTPAAQWYDLASKSGSLTLHSLPERIGNQSNAAFVVRRQQHSNAVASTSVRFRPSADGDEAGIAAFQNDDYFYSLGLTRVGGVQKVVLKRRAGPSDPAAGVTLAALPIKTNAGAPVYLRIAARGGKYDFFYGERRGSWRPLALDQDGTILSTKVAGGFVGSMFGLYAYGQPKAQ